MAVAAQLPAVAVQAAAAIGATPPPHRAEAAALAAGPQAVLNVEVRFRGKRKFVNHAPFMTVKAFLEIYRQRLGKPTLRVVDEQGTEQGEELTLETLATMASCRGASGAPVLRLDEDDWN